MSSAAATDVPYLQPYLRAAREHGGGFGSLLWASAKSQRSRFEAITRIYDLHGKSVLDAGCGRADLLSYLSEKGIHPADYTGLEAVNALAAEAETVAAKHANCRVLRGDFVRDPIRLFVGADVIVFSGSLNTIETDKFYDTLARAFEAATEAVVFNYLCSTALAGQDYLVWHRAEHVQGFLRQLPAAEVRVLNDYLQGDSTVAVIKAGETGGQELR